MYVGLDNIMYGNRLFQSLCSIYCMNSPRAEILFQPNSIMKNFLYSRIDGYCSKVRFLETDDQIEIFNDISGNFILELEVAV